jgi:hypothetical protein
MQVKHLSIRMHHQYFAELGTILRNIIDSFYSYISTLFSAKLQNQVSGRESNLFKIVEEKKFK